MRVIFHVPASLRQHAGGQRQICLEAAEPWTVGMAFERLHACYPGVVERALDEQGQPRQHVNIFVDGDSIRAGAKLGLATPVRDGAEIWILPSVSGGSG